MIRLDRRDTLESNLTHDTLIGETQIDVGRVALGEMELYTFTFNEAGHLTHLYAIQY